MTVFDADFAMLFRAVERIRKQLVTADDGLRVCLGEELLCLKRLGEQCIDHWMTLDDQISDLLETYRFPIDCSEPAAPGFPEEKSAQAALAGTLPTSRTAPDGVAVPILADLQGLSEWGWNLSGKIAVSFRRGLAYYDLFMFQNAAESLEEVAAQSDTPIASLYLAASYAASNHPDAARNWIASVRTSTMDPLFLCAADEIEAQVLMMEQSYNDALSVLRRIADCIPKYPDVWFNQCICFIHLGLDDTAEQVALRAMLLDPDDVETALLLGTIRLKLRKFEDAQEVCLAALDTHPQHCELLKLEAWISREQGDVTHCARVCRDITRLYPREEQAWAMLSWTYMKQGNYQQAQALLKQRLTLLPNSAEALLQLGVVTLLQSDYERAERILLHCLANHPNKSLVWIGLGSISMARGEHAQAHTRFLRATKDTRSEIRRLALYQYGRALMQASRHEEAEKYLKAAAVIGESSTAIATALAEIAEHRRSAWQTDTLQHRVGGTPPDR